MGKGREEKIGMGYERRECNEWKREKWGRKIEVRRERREKGWGRTGW